MTEEQNPDEIKVVKKKNASYLKDGEEPSQENGDEGQGTSEEMVDKLKEAEDRVLRVQADFENAKKRMQQRSDELVKFANEKLMEELIGVIDDMNRAIDSLDQGHEIEGVKQGLHMVQSSFHKILQQNGVEAIECLNQPFDPNLHEAVSQTVDNDREEDEVVNEVQKGFTLNGRLIRPSKVVISKKE